MVKAAKTTAGKPGRCIFSKDLWLKFKGFVNHVLDLPVPSAAKKVQTGCREVVTKYEYRVAKQGIVR